MHGQGERRPLIQKLQRLRVGPRRGHGRYSRRRGSEGGRPLPQLLRGAITRCILLVCIFIWVSDEKVHLRILFLQDFYNELRWLQDTAKLTYMKSCAFSTSTT